MKILELTKEEAKKTFEFISLNGISEDYFNDLSIEYLDIRKFFLSLDIPEIEYSYDLKLALKVYEFFNQQQWFNDSVASNYGFWMYLSLKVIPEIIINRHGWMPEYFYDKNVRIYIPTLYWYIHMSFQGDLEKTYNILKTLNTDYILQLVERPGRSGTYIQVSREIMRRIGLCSKIQLNEKISGANLFRRVLIQNTAKIDNFNLIFEDEIEKYVNDLFESCKISGGF